MSEDAKNFIVVKPDKGLLLDAVNDWARSSIETQPGVRRFNELNARAKQLYGVDINAVSARNYDNAAWMPRQAVKPFVKHFAKAYGVNPELAARRATKHGLIMLGRENKKRGVLAHEMGHAIAAASGTPVEKLTHNKNVDKYKTLYHTIPSALVAYFGGRGGRTGRGMLAGTVAGLITGAPTILGEIAANKYGRSLLSERDNAAVTYTPSLATYVAGHTLPYTLTGLLAGLRTARG